MSHLLKGVTIADPHSEYNHKTVDIRIQNGNITAIGALVTEKADQVIELENAVVSPGFFDLNCMIGDPGLETKEDLQTGTAAAQAGGFTGIAVLPTTKPVTQSKGEVAYILNKAKGNLVDVHPIGAISQNLEGKEMAELFDMKNAGAVAFSDGTKSLTDDGFVSRVLQYAKGFDGLVMLFPENKAIAGKAQVNESAVTTLLGMKGIPALAEEMQLSRDIFLATYHDSPLHVSNISTARAVSQIKKAKKEGVKITCDVAAHQLVFTEDILRDFDSNYKVKPPLRGKADVKALIAGLRDGTIDAVCSQHRPQEIEFKEVEFQIAEYGMIALQTVLPLLIKAGLDAQQIAEKLSLAPRRILKLPLSTIAVGQPANLVAYQPHEEWVYSDGNNASKSRNSALLGQKLKGKVKLVANNQQIYSYD